MKRDERCPALRDAGAQRLPRRTFTELGYGYPGGELNKMFS
jgi:hypothetical protein